MSEHLKKIDSFSKKVEFYFNTLLKSKGTVFNITNEVFDRGEILSTVYLYIEVKTYWDGDTITSLTNSLKNIEQEIFKFFNSNNMALTNRGEYLPYDKIGSDKFIMNVMGPVLYDIKWSRSEEELVLSYDVVFED